jgi:hypothetical protein
MKTLKRTALLVTIGCSALLVSGCDLRMDAGEDLAAANEVEKAVIKANLQYIKDQHDNCFAVLNNHTDGFRSTFTMAHVDCSSIGN